MWNHRTALNAAVGRATAGFLGLIPYPKVLRQAVGNMPCWALERRELEHTDDALLALLPIGIEPSNQLRQ
jgi:hypothetical protein